MHDLAIEQFLYLEAALLDTQKFDEWLGLLADNVTYLVPNFTDDGTLAENAVILKEDRAGLQARVARLAHRWNPTRKPAPRTLHTITNVVITEQFEDTVRVSSNLLYYVSKDRRILNYPAHVEHELVCIEEAWRIRVKTIYLLANDLPLGQLSLI